MEYSNYLDEDIYLITSDSANSNKDITGKYIESIEKIKLLFNRKNDSLFFYFAGHGHAFNGKSNLSFHNTDYPIEKIFRDVADLSPKIQFYVIDACESGNKVITRKPINDNIDEYITSSSGILFLYACQNNENALETLEKKHGVMTYYFIDALKNTKLYDEEGILTPGRIQEYVSKMASRDSNYNQIPVIENRVTGFYPFAFKNKQIIKQNMELVSLESQEIIEIQYDIQSRLKLQKAAAERLSKDVNSIRYDLEDNYVISEYERIYNLHLKNINVLISKIVDDASNNLECINDVFYYQKKPIFKNKFHAVAMILQSLGDSTEYEYEYIPTINEDNKYYNTRNMIFCSNSIRKVSFGIGFVIYQAKWGIVISIFDYLIDWDGENSTLIKDIRKEDYPFLIEADSEKEIQNIEIAIYSKIKDDIQRWNENRSKELEKFKIIKRRDD